LNGAARTARAKQSSPIIPPALAIPSRHQLGLGFRYTQPVDLGRKLAAAISGVKYIENPIGDHAVWTANNETMPGDIEEFVTGRRDHGTVEFERVLSTVLFTDIVDSTLSATAMSDERWLRLLDNHDQIARELVGKHRGNLVKSTGDGVLATFDGPGRAVRCALAFGSAAKQIGLSVRAGLHTGEIEIRGNDIAGIAVHAAARVMSQCDADEVLVSRVVTDLVVRAGLKFAERGSYELKGLPGKVGSICGERIIIETENHLCSLLGKGAECRRRQLLGP
jgi:class 3 adenylate cyclase